MMDASYDSCRLRQWVRHQTEYWPQAREGYLGLAQVQSRQLSAEGLSFTLLHNPLRRTSTLASVDRESILLRPCFLCREHRDRRQESLPLMEGYELLVNPFPIFPMHLTLAALDHRPQSIGGHIGDLLRATSLLRELTVFYNGPRCGASAPDHMHFQAVDRDLTNCGAFLGRKAVTVFQSESGTIQMERSARHALSINSDDAGGAEALTQQVLEGLSRIQEAGDGEPMVNILARRSGTRFSVLVIPRMRHRPVCFFEEGGRQLLISPASVDLAGCIVLPRLEDFRRLSAQDVGDIIRQVCLDDGKAGQLISLLKEPTS